MFYIKYIMWNLSYNCHYTALSCLKSGLTDAIMLGMN